MKNLKSVIVLVAFCALISVCSSKESFDRQDAVLWFEKLRNTDMGKEIYTSIQLELSSSQPSQNLVDRVLNMLQDLFNSITDEKDEAIEEKSQKKAFCLTKVSDLEAEIETVQEKVTRGKQTLPSLVEQRQSKQQQLEERQAEVGANDNILKEINDKNDLALAAYEQSVADHNTLIDSLNEAKRIISQLAVSSFLQDTQKTVFAQIKSIGDRISDNLKQQKGLISVLLDLAQNVGTQADQDQVAAIIAIIDELIAAEQHTADVERRAEQIRKQRYEYDVTRFQESTQYLEATIKDLQADSATLSTRITELQADVSHWTSTINDKSEQRDLQQSACDTQLFGLDKNVDEYNNLLDIIREVIRIFKSSSVQDVKSVVNP